MDPFRWLAYGLAAVAAAAGAVMLAWGGSLIVPGSGLSLAAPCGFLFWSVAIICWALAGARPAPEKEGDREGGSTDGGGEGAGDDGGAR